MTNHRWKFADILPSTTCWAGKQLLIYVTFCFCAISWHFGSAQRRLNAPAQVAECEPTALLLRAGKELKLGHASKAHELASMVYKCSRLTQKERFDLGVLYGRLHEFQTALTLFGSVSKDIPSLQAHAYAVGLGQFELGNYAEAAGTLKDLQTQQPLNGDSTVLLAVCYSKTGHYQDAYGLLVKHLQDAPNDRFGYLNLITLLTDVGQLQEAVKVANRAVEVFPDSSEMLIVRGIAYTAVSELDKARSDFADAAAKSPKLADPRFFLAVTDYKMSNYMVAAQELRSALAAGVVDADLEYLLAECMLKIDPEGVSDAFKELDRAIAISDKSASAYTLRGKLQLQRGEAGAAVVDLEKAHRINPAMRSATYNLARAYMVLGRKPEAELLYQQIQKESTDMVNELSDQRMGRALDEHDH